MARVIFSEAVGGDFGRNLECLSEHAPETAIDRIDNIIAALDILETSPLLGRPVQNGKRELVISTGASGYIALYRFMPESDAVFVLGIRSQRELGSRNTK